MPDIDITPEPADEPDEPWALGDLTDRPWPGWARIKEARDDS